MSTLNVVEEILRERGTPMVVREIVEAAAGRLPTRSKTPDTVVARDLAIDIKRRGDASKFIRVSPGHYTLRDLALAGACPPEPMPAAACDPVPEAAPEAVSEAITVPVTVGVVAPVAVMSLATPLAEPVPMPVPASGSGPLPIPTIIPAEHAPSIARVTEV